MRTIHLYRCFDKDGVLLYIGGTLYFQARVLGLRQKHEWFNNVSRVEIEHFNDRVKMRSAERASIASEEPKYNIVGNESMKARK